MSASFPDLLLLAVLLINLYVLAATRLAAGIKAVALQGGALALLPMAVAEPGEAFSLHIAAASLGTLALKAVVIPALLARSTRVAKVRHDVEPLGGAQLSVVLGAALTGVAFWMAGSLTLPRPAPTVLVVPVALATLFAGFVVVITRRKAITQVLGYLMLENGVYVFGLCLAHAMPFLVELSILLDILVGVFVMGIAIHHISREFDDIDTDALATLKD